MLAEPPCNPPPLPDFTVTGPNNWCSPFKSWHQVYMSDSREWIKEQGVDITEAKAKEL